MPIFLDCGELSLGNGSIQTKKGLVVDDETVQLEVEYVCDSRFQLYPTHMEPIKTCERNSEWNPNTELTCIPGKMHLVVVFFFNELW